MLGWVRLPVVAIPPADVGARRARLECPGVWVYPAHASEEQAPVGDPLAIVRAAEALDPVRAHRGLPSKQCSLYQAASEGRTGAWLVLSWALAS